VSYFPKGLNLPRTKCKEEILNHHSKRAKGHRDFVERERLFATLLIDLSNLRIPMTKGLFK